MKFKIEIDGSERVVEAAADGTVTIDGKSFKTQVSASGDEKRTVRVGDKTYELRLGKRIEGREGAPSEYLFEVSGEKVAVVAKEVTRQEPQAPAGAGATGPAATGGEPAEAEKEYTDGIFAPVPGKVADVRVKVGDKLVEGDVVLVLEAMKMENELHSPKAATVAAVLVNKGDQAAKDQLLVAFE